MKRRILILVLSVSLIFAAAVMLSSCASLIKKVVDGKYSEDLEYTLSEDEEYCIVTGIGKCKDRNIRIPPKHRNKPVKEIGASAFGYRKSLTSVKIPNSVTSIGDYAFYNCDSLTSVTIPNSVTSISDYAFYGCTSLASVAIPNRVTGIGDGAFDSCTSLTSVTIPNSVASIGDQAFYNCDSLTSVTIPDSVTSIGDKVFYKCWRLTSINYRGTEAEWSGISKGLYWDNATGNYTITYNYTGE